MAFTKYASVILDLSLNKPLDYGVKEEQLPFIERGVHVQVPIRGKLRTGYIFDVKEAPSYSPVLPIAKVLSDTALIPKDLFELALWVAKYYGTPLQKVLRTILPKSIRKDMQPKQQLFVMRGKVKEDLKQVCVEMRRKHPAQAAVLDVMLKVKKGILLSELMEKASVSKSPIDTLTKKGYLLVDIVRIDRSPLVNEEYFPTKSKTLNGEQSEALKKITASLTQRKFEAHLIHGITGSGKTEIYLQAINKALEEKKGTIMLVPEISLTAQTIERFRSRFKEKIAILHYRLSDGERCDEWHKIRSGEAQIVIGARSAIFSPVVNLGLIIVDEEHEQSYKQNEESPRYHARDVAVMRGKLSQSTVILGSATPSLESYYNASIGKYTLSTLKVRADAAALPTVTIVDMKKEFEKAKGYTTFSERLLEGIKKRQERGEQTILFLNRRGYHTTLFCKQCSHVIKCPHCDLALTFHISENKLSCHLCGDSLSPPPSHCPSCKSNKTMKYRGVGTQLVQKALHAIFPDIRTIRIDADTTRHKGSHQKLLRSFGSGKADVLIGTQMIAKGLHFPQVTLVGVLNSDASLNLPDFRASEAVFQLLTQVAGRAGRGAVKGEVIVQTCMPENPTILLAAAQDYEKFYAEEIAVRETFHYPPFTHMAKITFVGKEQKKLQQVGQQIRYLLSQRLPGAFHLHALLPAGYAKVKDHYRYQFLVRGQSMYTLNKEVEKILQETPPPSQVKVQIDIDPTSTF